MRSPLCRLRGARAFRPPACGQRAPKGRRGPKIVRMCDERAGGVGDWRGLSHDARLDALVDLESRIASLQAQQLSLLAVIDGDPATVSLPGSGDKRWAVEDVACALRLSPGVARARLAEAVESVRLPRALALLAAGRITAGHLRALTDSTIALDDLAVRAVEARVIERAAEQSVATFRAGVRRAVLSICAPTLEQRRQANIGDRRVCLRPSGEGTSELWALLPDEGAATLMAAVAAFADRREAGDDRTADQRRADALVQLGLDALSGHQSSTLPPRHRLRPAVSVHVALSTLLRLDDEPGELEGVGAISAELARQLAADPSGTWRRLVTDPLGRLIDCGRSTYRPPAELARHVIARDRTCRFPHCSRTAARAELDHTRPWADGGRTNEANLVALCPRHHHLRHETGWDYRRSRESGVVVWRSPSGRTVESDLPAYPIDGTADPPPS